MKHDAAKETVARETEPKDKGAVETPQTPMRSEKIESGWCAVRGAAEEAREASDTNPQIRSKMPEMHQGLPYTKIKLFQYPMLGNVGFW